VVPILVLAAFLRLWGLAGQPVLYFDSGQYLGEARFLSSAARAAATALAQPGDPNPLKRVVQGVEAGTQAHAPDNAKVGHAILLAASMLVFGTNVFAAVLVSALAAIGTVVAVYVIGNEAWGQRVGLLAALLLAISAWHLTYSREAYAEADMVLFATLAFLVYLHSDGWRSLLATGLLLGLAFSCNTRASYLPLVLLPTELLAWRDRGWGRWQAGVQRAALLGVGYLAPPALLEGAYVAARSIGRIYGSDTSWPDYAQQLAAYWQQHPVIIRFDQWPSFFVDLSLLDGIYLLPLVIGGVVVAFARPKRRQEVLLLTALLVPIVLYSVYVAGAVRMRAFSLALPWVMLGAALGLDALVRLLPKQRLIVAAFATGLVVLAMPRDLELMSAPNGVPALLSYLNQAGITDVASTDGAVLGFYVGEDHTNAKFRAAYINAPDDLNQLEQRYRFVAVEMQGYLFPNEVAQRFLDAGPLFAVAHGSPTWYLASLLENRGVRWGEWDLLLADWRRYVSAATELRVQDLHELAHD
jgi:hypothetical protein